ncbi:hepatic lectin-like [Chelmon rostratus]|uniref:hepatic lectin-like n=1 Tax=Chelmon rostratus TaxID=109905 RepID=UPI001BE888EC|nr:hepatic lectin-like [Chelmon rostratus]
MMSHPDGHDEGEAPASQQCSGADGRSKVTSERVALLVVSVLLAAAVIVICRLSVANIQTKKSLQTLRDEHEAVIRNLTAETCLKCQEGWEEHGGHCYYFSTNRSPWNRSREECRRKGGDLVQIDSTEEQSFLAMKLRDKMSFPEDRFWIGLTDSQEEGAWLWVDGSPLNIRLAFWSDRQPDDWKGEDKDGEDCARMGEKGSSHPNSWFDKSCKRSQKSICEKQKCGGVK